MKNSSWLILGVAGAGGLAAARVMTKRKAPSGGSRATHSITVFRPVEHVAANLPPLLTEREDALDVLMREAPGGRGTEIHVRRLNDTVPDDEIREALRTGRSRIETGDVLLPGIPTTTPTVLNRGLRAVTSHGRQKGLL